MTKSIVAALLIAVLSLLLPAATRAEAGTTIAFTANTHGEHSPCPT
jgi:hypothetical protein